MKIKNLCKISSAKVILRLGRAMKLSVLFSNKTVNYIAVTSSLKIVAFFKEIETDTLTKLWQP